MVELRYAYCTWPDYFPGETCVVMSAQTMSFIVERSNKHYYDNVRLLKELEALKEQCEILSNQFLVDLDHEEEMRMKDYRIKLLEDDNSKLAVKLAQTNVLLFESEMSVDWGPTLKMEIEKIQRNCSQAIGAFAEECKDQLASLKRNFNVRLGNVEQSFAKLKEKHVLVVKERNLLVDKVKILEADFEALCEMQEAPPPPVSKSEPDMLLQTQELLLKVTNENALLKEKLRDSRKYFMHAVFLFTELCNSRQQDYKFSTETMMKICETGPMLNADARQFAMDAPEFYAEVLHAVDLAEKAFVKSKWNGEKFTVDVSEEYSKAGIPSDTFTEESKRYLIMSLMLLQVVGECKNKKSTSIPDEMLVAVLPMIPRLMESASSLANIHEFVVPHYLACRVTLDAGPLRKYQSFDFFRNLNLSTAKSRLDNLILRDRRYFFFIVATNTI